MIFGVDSGSNSLEKTPEASFQLLSHQSHPKPKKNCWISQTRTINMKQNVGIIYQTLSFWDYFLSFSLTQQGLSSHSNNKHSEFNVKATFAELLGFQESLILKWPRMEVAQISNVWPIYLLLGNLRVNVDKYIEVRGYVYHQTNSTKM